MQTPEFGEQLADLMVRARERRIVLMCAEAVPWRCHRSLIADALVARGVVVEEIQSATRTSVHSLTPFARINAGVVTYPLEASSITPRGRP
jgi:uncharacterized protein (DUF488 family)